MAHMTLSVFLVILAWMGPNPELQAQAASPAQSSPPAAQLQASRSENASQDSKGKRVMYLVAPVKTDPNIKDGDGDNLVLFDQSVAPNANLLVFIGGTARYHGADQPGFEVSQAFAKSFPSPFLSLAVELGYRVISLDFKYDPAGTVICPPRITQDRFCYERFREKKIFGSGDMPEVPTSPPESIVNRLTKLLQYVAREYPDQGWEGYLVNGQPNWGRIALTGHSQGAGLAAFLAKRAKVARVILNSSPWDHYERPPGVAAWLSWPSATPYERWYGLYHAKEGQAMWMDRTYAALRVPHDHIRVEKLQPRHPPGINGDHYHFGVIGINFTPLDADGNYAYRGDWAFALGQGTPSEH